MGPDQESQGGGSPNNRVDDVNRFGVEGEPRSSVVPGRESWEGMYGPSRRQVVESPLHETCGVGERKTRSEV